jgi:hypothetical protein
LRGGDWEPGPRFIEADVHRGTETIRELSAIGLRAKNRIERQALKRERLSLQARLDCVSEDFYVPLPDLGVVVINRVRIVRPDDVDPREGFSRKLFFEDSDSLGEREE